MNWTRLRKVLETTAVTLALVAGISVSADANTGGGIGGGGGAGGAYSGFEWTSIVGAKGSVYETFVQQSGYSYDRAFLDAEVTRRVGSVQVCKDSEVIWFVRSPGGWTYNFTGRTHPTNGVVAGTIEWPNSQYGNRAPNGEEITRFKDWDYWQNRNQIDNTPGYTIICSGLYTRPDITWRGSSTRVSSDTTTVGPVWTFPYSYTTAIDRQSLKNDGGIDPIGVNNLHGQTSTVRTKFGELYDSLNTAAGAGLSPADLQNRVSDALATDAATERPQIDLDQANKDGMAEGGVLNVSLKAKLASVSSVERTIVTTTTTCDYRQTWSSAWATYNAPTSNCWDTSTTSTSRTSSKSDTGTPQTQGFWQMLSVHCNQEEFDALINADAATKWNVYASGTQDATRTISAFAVTGMSLTQPAPRDLDFAPVEGAILKGQTPVLPEKLRTAELGFYDKECPFDCTPSNVSTDGASAANGADKNVGSPGAISGANNANAFEFFRDNAAKTIKIDTWYPKKSNTVDYKGEAPVTTTVTRDVAGTPSIDGSSGGKFTMKSTKGDTFFSNAVAQASPTQTNWDTTTFSSPIATVLKGLHNNVTVQSTWASEAGKPQAFNFKWEYAPKVKTKIPLTSIGFGVGGGRDLGNFGEASTAIEGKCYTYFGTSSSPSNTVAEFGYNTGSGTVNGLDQGLLTGDKASAKMTTNFVRSTTE